MRAALCAAAIALALGAEAQARSFSYLCENPSGVSVPLPGAPTIETEADGISGGFYHVTIGDDGVDVTFRDVTGRNHNMRQNGANIRFSAFENDTARIDVLDPRYPLESFTFLLHHTGDSAFLTYVQITPTTGLIPRVSVFQGPCEVIRAGG